MFTVVRTRGVYSRFFFTEIIPTLLSNRLRILFLVSRVWKFFLVKLYTFFVLILKFTVDRTSKYIKKLTFVVKQ